MTEATTGKRGAAKWVLYGSAALTTTLLFAADPLTWPKVPGWMGD